MIIALSKGQKIEKSKMTEHILKYRKVLQNH